MKKSERNSPVCTKVKEVKEGGDTPGLRAEIPLQPMERTRVKEVVAPQPMEDDHEQIPTCSP